MRNSRSVVIIGGGFSGTLQAVNLLRHDGPRAILIERRPEVGVGIAYSTAHPGHLLNVRASNMSAFPDEPDHFVRWLAKQGHSGEGPFVPRALYGRYLADLVEAARRRAPDRFELVRGEAVGMELARGVEVALADGRTIAADAAVLALGNLPPALPDNLDPQRLGNRYVGDPWSPAASADLDRNDHVLIVGTGLTMVDVVLLLEAHGFRGPITAISRRGLVPRVQAPGGLAGKGLTERPSGEVSSLLRTVRTRACVIGWHAAIDELRPFTQAMWRAATLAQQQRFLRHLRPWWDVHRHRLAPSVARQIEMMRAEGRLRIVAGRTLGFEPRETDIDVVWRPRGTNATKQLSASRIINCTGPQSDLARTGEALLLALMRQRAAASDAHGLGLSVDVQGRLLDANGRSNPWVFALGPLTRGTFWEITAVPDIRLQTWNLARYLSDAHWVGGEGL